MDVTTLSPDLRRLFGSARLYSDGRLYAVVSLPRDQMRAATILFGGLAEPFAAMIVDRDEITIVMHEMDWSVAGRDLPGMRVLNDYRLITLDVELAADVTGFMDAVCRLLAGAGVPMLPLAAYSRDHILVRARDLDRTWQVLSDCIAACR
ncbi:MAG TPA: ACT domain-containing protein [Anaerolineae bacterium]|nr:ACT domain-containing protein [Anaerolineae bacterium]